jgi:hypothetical protein
VTALLVVIMPLVADDLDTKVTFGPELLTCPVVSSCETISPATSQLILVSV